jgi:hypothetical protein
VETDIGQELWGIRQDGNMEVKSVSYIIALVSIVSKGLS